MRKIAIVDDEQEERDSLQECFEQFQKENAIKLEIKTYCSGDVFLQQFDASYDLICLDIDMDGTTISHLFFFCKRIWIQNIASAHCRTGDEYGAFLLSKTR